MQRTLLQKTPPWTILEVLRWATSYFGSINIESPRLESEIILSHVLGIERIELYINRDSFLSNAELDECIKLFCRKANREPISYIIGYKEFWSIDFKVNQSVLIPRSETECLVSSVIPFLSISSHVPMKVLDLGTGSGAIILALASEFSLHQFYALDISHDAILLAKKNALRNKLSKNVNFLTSCWTDALKPNIAVFDLIVSNPPYIKSYDISSLQPEVGMYEPEIALDGGSDGLDSFRRVIKDSLLYLRIGGLLALEIGWDQGKEVKQIANSCGGYSDIRVFRDYSGLDRIVHMIKN